MEPREGPPREIDEITWALVAIAVIAALRLFLGLHRGEGVTGDMIWAAASTLGALVFATIRLLREKAARR